MNDGCTVAPAAPSLSLCTQANAPSIQTNPRQTAVDCIEVSFGHPVVPSSVIYETIRVLWRKYQLELPERHAMGVN